MTRIPILSCVASLVLGAAVSAQTRPSVSQQDRDVAARIQRVESGLLHPVLIKGSPGMKLADRMAHFQVPGLGVAVIHEGKIEWARGYGVIEKGRPDPVTPATRFLAGSISKPVAALAALRLVEQDKLSLDEDVNLKLKTWKVPENDFTKEQKVTLRRLLSHSAGMTVHGFPGYEVDGPVPTLVQILNGEPPANTGAIKVDLVPGTRCRYSGGGYTVMQQLLMDAAGKSFAELTRELVLAPVGMEHSTYENPPPSAVAAAAATAHRAGGDKVDGRWHVYPEMAAAGLWTTPSDLARYAIEVQRAWAGQSAVLSQSMARQMLTVQKGAFGLGPSLDDADKDTGRFGHGGVDEGFDAYFTAYCQRGQGAVVMMNANRAMPLALEVIRAIAREYQWPDFLPAERTVASVDPKIYASYAGQYELGSEGTATVSVDDGRLFLHPSGQSKEELFPESDTTFFFVIQPGLTVTFVKDAAGQVTGLKVRRGDHEETAKKMK